MNKKIIIIVTFLILNITLFSQITFFHLNGVQIGVNANTYVTSHINDVPQPDLLNITITNLDLSSITPGTVILALARLENGIFVPETTVIDFAMEIPDDGISKVYIDSDLKKGVDVSTLPSGTYAILLYHKPPGATDPVPFYVNDTYFLTIENKRTFTYESVDFEILYTDNMIVNKKKGTTDIATYLQMVENSIKKSCDDQITKMTCITPHDIDNVYKVFINDAINDSVDFKYHQGIESDGNGLSANPRYDYRAINLYVDPLSFLNASTSIDEQSLLDMTIGHEFYHGIQFSYISYEKIKSSFPVDPSVELEKRFWLIEGQAKFLETIFFEGEPVNFPFLTGLNIGSYDYYIKEFLIQSLYTPYTYRSIHDMNNGYEFCLFWRFLYENALSDTFIEDNPTDKTPLYNLLKETCKQYDIINNSDFSSIKQIMNNAILSNPEGSMRYSTFDEILADFAKHTYLHDNSWGLWDDPNENNFYTSSYSSVSITPDPTFIDAPSCGGNVTSGNFDITKSFAFRTHEHYYTGRLCSENRIIEFSYTETDAQFNVTCLQMKGNTIVETYDFDIKSQKGVIQVCPGRDKLVVIVTRLDANEGTVHGDYTLTIKNVPLDPILDFMPVVDYSNDIYSIECADNSSSSYFSDLVWVVDKIVTTGPGPVTKTFTTGGTYSIDYIGRFCKEKHRALKDFHILPCFVEKLELSQAGNAIGVFSRNYDDIKAKFEFKRESYRIVEKGDVLKLTITTSLPLTAITIKIFDSDLKEVYSHTPDAISAPGMNSWTINVPTESMTKGIYTIQLNAADAKGNELVNIKEPGVPPIKVDEDKAGWGISMADITGIDGNYYFWVNDATGSKIDISTTDECGDHRATFFNYSNNTYYIDFGDGQESLIEPASSVEHSYASKGTYKYKISKSDNTLVEEAFVNFYSY